VASSCTTGDETTWDATTKECRTSGVEGPPLWHAGQEVIDEMTPANDPKII
jgi:hypothetical protein